jgi:hypothetical protein
MASPPVSKPFYTADDLVLEALANLGVFAAGQTVSPEDYNYVNDRIDAIFRKLAALEICYVPDFENIPGEWFIDLAAIVAGECAVKFGASADYIGVLIQSGLGTPPGSGTAALSLKQMLRGRPTGEPQRTESF